jgi:hypothetical protein
MARDEQDFLARWSRRKQEAAAKSATEAAKPRAPAESAPALPALDQLTPDSDFSAFMKAKIDERVRRAALKKLFADPRFNVIDAMDVYIDDYSISDPIPPEMLAQLQHSKSTLNPPVAQAQAGSEADAAAASAQAAAPAAVASTDRPVPEAPPADESLTAGAGAADAQRTEGDDGARG